jgi:hypothetical protein
LKLENLFVGRVHIGIVSIIFIIALSYGLLFYLHNITEQEVRKSLFDQQVQRQMEATKSISEHISSDLSLVMNMLDGLANSIYLQEGDLSGDGAKKIIEEKYNQFNTIVNRLFILDKDDIVTVILAPKRSDISVGTDFSFRDWVKETRSSLMPVFSDGFERMGIYRIFITYPIINRTSGEYIGLLGTSIPTVQFFAHYGNVDNINSQFLVAYNKNATLLANGASQDLVGEYFFGSEAQKLINYNEILNNSTRQLLAGKADYAVYDYGKGERLTTGYPIFVNDDPRYFIQVVTPTAEIYAHVGDVLFIQRIRMFSFLAATTTAAIAVLILLLTKWNVILRKEVKRRTRELEESYDEMKVYLDTVLAELKRDATIKGKYKK